MMRTIRIKCTECKKEFERPITGKRTVCSDECATARKNRLNRESRKRAAAATAGRCLHCGNEIPMRQKYCTKRECQLARKRANYVAANERYAKLMRNEKKRQCPECGRWFAKRSKMYVTCGREECVKSRAKKIKAEGSRVREERRKRERSMTEVRLAAQTPPEEMERKIANAQCPFAGEWKDEKGRIWPQMSTNIPGVTWDDPIMDPMSGGFPMRYFTAPMAQEVAA